MNTPKITITAWPMNDDWNSITGSWSRNTYYSEVAAEYTLSSHVDTLILPYKTEVNRLREALVISEAALSDIGDAHREEGDDLAWCERRAAKAIPIVRKALCAIKGYN